MIGFQEFIKSKGFKDFRYIIKGKKWELVSHKECGISENSFSTMVHGGLDIRYVKDNITIIWGLNEVGKPPTLIYPRPKVKNNNLFILYNDDLMNRILKNYSNEDIFNAMFETDKYIEICE